MDAPLPRVVLLGKMAEGRLQIVNMAPKPKGHMDSPPHKMSAVVGTCTLDLFKDLNNVDEEKQTECIARLVKHFIEDPRGVRGEDGKISAELNYTLKRLIRGLSSPNPGVLRGYFTALSCLLSSLLDITCEDVKLHVDKELSNASGLISAEKNQLLIARTLAWGVLMRSGLLLNAPAEQQKEIFTDLLTCSKKKSYLPLAAFSFLIDIIPTLETSTFRSVVWPILKGELLKPWEKQTLDSLLLLLVCQKHHNNVIKAKYLRLNLGTEAVLTEETMKHFAHRLLFSIYLKHPLYRVFSECLNEPEQAPLLQKFWSEEIPKLLSTVKNKDLATLELFSNMVESAGPRDQILLILSDRVVSFLNNTLSDSYKLMYREVYERARKAVVLVGSVLTNPEASDAIRLSVLKILLFKSSKLEFEKTSQNLEKSTHVITILIGLLESESAKELADALKAALSSDPQRSKRDITFAVQQFSRLVCHSNIEDKQWRVDQLKFLIRQSFFKSKHLALTDAVSSTLKQSFFKALGTKSPSLENLLDILNILSNYVQELLDAGVSPRVPLSAESFASWKKMLALVNKMKGSKPGSVQQIFHLLFVYMGLYIFMDAPMALDALKELHSCYEHSTSKTGKKRMSVKTDDEPNWIEVTVEVLLSLLSHGSNLLRTVVGIVFTHLRKHITPAALHQILEVLHPEESENALSIVDDANGATVESDGEESSDEESSDKDDSDVENAEDSSDASSIEDDENSDLEDESLDEEETPNDQLRSEIRDVLGDGASDNESVDMDEADEEELRRVDEALVKAYQSAQSKRPAQKGKKNKKQSKIDELLMHFRLRALELLDIFLAKTPPFSLILPIIQPLLSLLEVSSRDVHLKSLASRVRSLLNKVSSLKKFPSLEGVTHADIAELLTALINKGNRTAAVFLETVNVVTDCCTMLVRCSEHLPVTEDDDATEVVNICKEALKSFLKKRDCLLPIGFFRSILSLHWEGCWELGDLLAKAAFDTELRPIRRINSVELLSTLFKNSRLMNSGITVEKQHLENLTSVLISNAVNLFENSSPNASLQQKYVVGLYHALYLCLSQHKASPKQLSELSNALCKFSEKNPPHGETKRRFNELRRILSCEGRRNVLSPKKEGSKKQTEHEGVQLNGHREDKLDLTTGNGSVNEEIISASKKKKKKRKGNLSQEIQHGHEEEVSPSKRQRKGNQTCEGNEWSKKGSEGKRTEAEGESIPHKKSKRVNMNGVSKGGNQPGPLTPDGVNKKKKKKAPAV